VGKEGGFKQLRRELCGLGTRGPLTLRASMAWGIGTLPRDCTGGKKFEGTLCDFLLLFGGAKGMELEQKRSDLLQKQLARNGNLDFRRERTFHIRGRRGGGMRFHEGEKRTEVCKDAMLHLALLTRAKNAKTSNA